MMFERAFLRTFLVAAFSAAAIGCGREDVNATLQKVSQARELAAHLTVQFTMTSDAANRAVMADTDEASVQFAKESRESAAAVQNDVDQLRGTLATLGYADEDKLLTDFAKHFAEYRRLDDNVLGLAVENTNLKAQRLAFGPAQDAANTFRDALKALMPAKPGDAWHVYALSNAAVMTVREIQVLQAPHIADADDSVMTRMEHQMATSQTAARRDLDSLREIVTPESRSKLIAADAALKRFMELNSQLVALSRRNTNVHSLMLSLDEKRKMTLACQSDLQALQASLSKRGYSGIRER
jgi:methyl-accepting chemotaxis protein